MATIAKRKHGYCVQIRRKGFAAISRTFPSHAEAVAWADQEEAKRTTQSGQRKRQTQNLRNVTLRQILSRYLKEVSSQKIGWLNEHYQLAALMRAPLADLSLEELSVTDLARYRDERLKFVKAGTVCRELGLVQRVHSEHQRVTRPWFFAQDGGHYVQCKYGSKPLALSKDGNAVFVKELTEVTSVLQAFYAAAAAGEFDSAIADAAKRPARA